MQTSPRIESLKVDRGLTLSKLTQNSSRSIVRGIIKEQIKFIDSKILTAHNSGFNQIEHELPINFGINNMDKSNAQIMVYSEIIYMLTLPEAEGGKGFEEDNVTIEISAAGEHAVLWIKWMNGMDVDEQSLRKQIIRRHGLKRSVKK